MKNTFSKNFILRLMLGVTGSVIAIVFLSIIFQKNNSSNENLEKFKPIDRINRLSDISFRSKNYFSNTNNDLISIQENSELINFQHRILINKLNSINCNRRQKALIFEDLLVSNEPLIISKKKYASFLINTIENNYKNKTLECSHFIRDINTLENLLLVNSKISRFETKTIIENFLTEHISWNWRSPCLYLENNKKDLIYFSGSVSDCFYNKKAKSFSEIKLENEISLLAKVVHDQLSFFDSKKVKEHRDFVLTLDPHIQGWLNLYKKCFKFLEHCGVTSVKSPAKMNNLSVVVLNSDNNEILGSICVGKKCKESGLEVFKDLASFHVVSPPASISKLIYAMSFALTDSVEKQMLLRQIKTSGQINPSLGTRNEWWERNSICDNYRGPKCVHQENVAGLSKLFGISTNCVDESKESGEKRLPIENFSCGKVNLIKLNDELNYLHSKGTISGFLGFLPLSKKYFLDVNGSIKYMNWENYEKIRRKKNHLSKKKEFLNSSNIIQSVIGGGDSRVSSLGIASIVSQIKQLANKKSPSLPSLIKIRETTTLLENYEEENSLTRYVQSARYVMSGMKKSLLKEEIGWSGNGTAYKSFRDIFNKDCVNDCPIIGKTGTVSYRDKNFAGTTLFSGLVDTKKMKYFLNIEQNTSLPNLAIGVIVFNEKDKSEGHYASKLFMALVKDITSNKNLYKISQEKKLLLEKNYLLMYGS